MAAVSSTERLTPLDLLMPPTYIRVLFAFHTTESLSSAFERLQHGLDGLAKRVPWLSGRVTSVAQSEESRSLEIRWHPDETVLALVNKGTIAASYEAMAAKGMPPEEIPNDVWPTPPFVQDGGPVFAASIFRFADGKGLGLCMGAHHNGVDGTGFGDIVRLWTQELAGNSSQMVIQGRYDRLSNALSSDLAAVASLPVEDVWTAHPEYTRAIPVPSAMMVPCTSKILGISMATVNRYKEKLMSQHLSTASPSTNTIVCGLVWSAVARARKAGHPSLADKTSQLLTAVDGRRRIGTDFSTPEKPYLGNVALYARSQRSTKNLAASLSSSSSSVEQLAKTCDAIGQAQSPASIGSHSFAEVYSLLNSVKDYRAIFPGCNPSHGYDLMITSWAGLELRNMDFGGGLGQPEFVRLPYMEADGVCIVMPRKRGPSEVVEVVVLLNRQDMAILEKDDLWSKGTN